MTLVRPAAPADAGAWLRMRRALWPEEEGDGHAGEVEQYFAGRLSMPLEVLLAFGADGAPLGFAELSIRPYAEGCTSERVAYLEGWYVVPEARRRGVGRSLVEGAERWAVAQGCTEFASDALVENAVSAEAHRALGFEEVERIRCFRKDLDAAAAPAVDSGDAGRVSKAGGASPAPASLDPTAVDPTAEKLARLREAFARAEMEGDVSFFERVLTEDAVILAPWFPAFEGREACLGFIGGVLADVNREFERELTCTSLEVQRHGDWAFDRGIFRQRLVRRDDGAELDESGKYFWLYRRSAEGAWRLARIVGNYDGERDTPVEPESPRA